MFESLRRLALVAVVLLAGASAAKAGPYSGLVVFGDSLSDAGSNATLGLYDPGQVVTGNDYVATSAYAAGTYTNGPVWASYLAAQLGLPTVKSWLQSGTNYANGGATMSTAGIGPFGYPFNLRLQSWLYLGANGGRAAADTLYVVAGGGNDARDAVERILPLDLGNPTQQAAAIDIVIATAQSIIAGLDGIIDGLWNGGARNIVVWNVPNIGLAPEQDTPYAEWLASLVASALNQFIEAYLATKPVELFDVFDIGSIVAAFPAEFGLSNVDDACGAAPVGTDCNTYLWWDGAHPTTYIHALIAAALGAQLQPAPTPLAAPRLAALVAAEVPAPAAVLLLVPGLAAIAVARRRRTA